MSALPDGAAGRPRFSVRLPAAPYPGLRPFEKDEWPIYFGRERMADAIVQSLLQRRVLVLHGDSGCGKSSLVRAAILPKLEQENARGGVDWRTCIAVPGEAPLWNVARALARMERERPNEDRVRQFRRALNYGRAAPSALAELLGAGEATRVHVCILIDQFEELFEHARRHGPDEARLLTDLLVALHEQRPEGLYAALTMRSEFIGACGHYAGFAELVNATQYLLPRMDHDDLLRAICEPATLYGGSVDRDLAARLIAETGSDQDQLPLIQHGLMRMYLSVVLDQPDTTYLSLPTSGAAGRPPWRLGLEHYPAEGGLSGLLSRHADAVMKRAQKRFPPPAESDRVIEEIFRALTEINAEGQALRRPRSLRELIAVANADEARVRGVIDLYRAERVSLLRPYGSEPLDLDERIDIGHEALIRCWGRLGGDRKDGWLYREFRSGMVWRSLLVQVESFRGDSSNVLGPAATIERTEWMRRRNRAWAERYGGEWDGVQALLAASAKARRRSLLLRVIAPLVLFLSVALGVAIKSWLNAQDELALARQQAEATDAARARSEKQQQTAQQSAAVLREVGDRLADYTKQPPTAAEWRSIQDVTKELQQQANVLAANAPEIPAGETPGARIYIHITDEAQRSAARALQQELRRIRLESGRVVVPGVELVKHGPGRNVLRCFKSAECENDARRLLGVINTLVLSTKFELQDLSDRYGDSTKLRPLHFEVWFAPGEIRLAEIPGVPANVTFEILTCAPAAANGSYEVRYAPNSPGETAALALLDNAKFKAVAPWRSLSSDTQKADTVSMVVCPSTK
ncbi:MAG TPA: hypothetical protein VMG60_24680 [Burkholderiaceae bacterium]|nr:hypothetical protein [Burkholderiaceae bacterium]